MASQEDYLDNLLKGMSGIDAEPENIHKTEPEAAEDLLAAASAEDPFDPFGESESAEDFLMGEAPAEDLLAAVSAEDLLAESDPFGESESAEDFLTGEAPAEDLLAAVSAEDLLAADGGDSEEGIFGAMDEMLSDEDVLKMLAEDDSGDAEGLPGPAEKTGNDAGTGGLDGFEGTADDIFETAAVRNARAGQEKAENVKAAAGEKKKEAVGEERESPAQRKERKKAEAAVKKAEKQAAREASRLAKAEKKAQQGKKEKKPVKKAAAGAEEPVEAAGKEEQAGEDLMDMSLLDSILSEANNAGKKPEPQEEAEDQLGFLDVGGEEPIDFSFGETETDQEKKNDLGIDLDNMFPDTGIDLGGDDSFSFSDDAMELDLDEADQMIPERGTDSEGGKKGGEKKSLFSRLRDFLTEEDEEEDGENPFFQDGQDSEEGSKGKPGGNKSSKKGSASKKEKEKAKKEAKPKKPAKPKKAPAPKKGKAPGESSPDNGKKLSFKKMLPVLVIGVSVGVLLFLFVNAATVYSDRSNARTAFYMGDYNTCYQNLKGKKLDETESIMFGKSASILYSRLWIREYEVFTESGDSVRALDSLIQAIDYYPELQEYAARWNALSEVAAGYAEVLNLLEGKFGLTESQAKEIALQRRDVDYTRMITAIVEGQSPGSGTGAPGSQNTPDVPKDSKEPEGSSAEDDSQSLADPLPEEEGIGDGTFIGN